MLIVAVIVRTGVSLLRSEKSLLLRVVITLPNEVLSIPKIKLKWFRLLILV